MRELPVVQDTVGTIPHWQPQKVCPTFFGVLLPSIALGSKSLQGNNVGWHGPSHADRRSGM
jgi:hypothetical protein